MMGNETIPEAKELQAFGVSVGSAIADGYMKNANAGAAELLQVRGRESFRVRKKLRVARRTDHERAEHVDHRRAANQIDGA